MNRSTPLSLLSRLCLVCGLTLPFVAACLSAAEPPANPAPPLRVGISPVFPPMAFKQGKELVGAEVDLARALGTKLNRPVVFVELPWKDQIDALNSSRTDIIMSSMSITPARRHLVQFTQPYLLVGQMALVPRTDVHKYLLGFPATLPGVVGVLPATTGEFLVQRDFPRAKLKQFKTSADAVRALQRNKISMFISDSTLVWHLAARHAADGLTVAPLPLSEEQLAWAVRKSDTSLHSSAEQLISDSLKDGSLIKTLQRWTAIGN